MRFDGKVVLATGTATGLGRSAVRLFATEGAKLVLVDYNESGLKELAAELRATGTEVVEIVGDVSLADTADKAVAAAVDAFGTVDILFNNAGINPVGTLVDTSEEVWDKTMAVNVKSAYLFSVRAIPIMERAGKGVIVNTASTSSFKASNGEAVYGISKAALMHLTKVLARDFAAKNIRVNALCPGFMEVYMADRRSTATPEQERVRREKAAAGVPMGREGTYAENAKAVAFLASDDASYITGTSLISDGGQFC